MNPLAIIPAYNEADIIGPVIRHLQAQGCDVHVIDNWSTDDTLAIAYEAGASIEAWPETRPSGSVYDWTGILKRIEEVAHAHPGRWIVFHDADEVRELPLPFHFAHLAASGYNALSFRVCHFLPIDNTFVPGSDPEPHFRYYKPEHIDTGLAHVKAWFQGNDRVDLHSTGGHEAIFAGRKICPGPFLLKHYPIRSEEHGRRKIFTERVPRYASAELAQRWHVQYDAYKAGAPLLGNPAELRRDQRNVTIVTLTRFPEIFERFAASVERYEPQHRKIVVTSGGCQIAPEWIEKGWEVIEGAEPFVFARNLNLGIAAAPDDDILASNDDVELLAPVIEELQGVFEYGRAGIVTPRIEGNGINLELAWASERFPAGRYAMAPSYVPFVCVLLNRDMLRVTAPLDESFTGYGGDDIEFGRRANARAWDAWVAGAALVKHGFGECAYSSSFLRTMTPAERQRSMQAMNALLAAK